MGDGSWEFSVAVADLNQKQTTENRQQSEANGSGISSHPFSRFPFQFFVHEQSSPTKRFPLQSGLERKQIAYL